MSGFKGMVYRNSVLDSILGSGSPASFDVALYTTMPDASGVGGVEVGTGLGYSRLTVTNNATNFPAAVSGVKHNGATWSFGPATSNWGALAGAALLDGSGNIVYAGPFPAPITVNAPNPFSIAAGNATFTES